jgi:hypothetical protein
MKKLTIAIAMCAIAMTSHAAPNKAAADAWGQDFRRLKDKASDALVLRDSVGGKRSSMRTDLDKLTQRAAKMWGEFSVCHKAAHTLQLAYDETGTVMRQSDHAATSLLFRFAMESGQSWASCRDEIDNAK